MKFGISRLLPACVLFTLANPAAAVNVIINDAAGSKNCGTLSTLSQDSTTITINVSATCVATSAPPPNPTPPPAEDPNPAPPPPPTTVDACVSGNGIVCKGPIEVGTITLPHFEGKDTVLRRGEIHVYSFVYRESIGSGQMGPVFKGLRIIKISKTPGDLAYSSDGCYLSQRTNLQNIKYESATLSAKSYACDLVDGQTYYLSFKTKNLYGDDNYRLVGSAN